MILILVVLACALAIIVVSRVFNARQDDKAQIAYLSESGRRVGKELHEAYDALKVATTERQNIGASFDRAVETSQVRDDNLAELIGLLEIAREEMRRRYHGKRVMPAEVVAVFDFVFAQDQGPEIPEDPAAYVDPVEGV